MRPISEARPTDAAFTAFDLKSVAADGAFEGYASLFNTEDLGRDVILPGAFRDTLVTRGAANIRMLFQHNPAEPIGAWESLAEDAKGLFARGRIATQAPRAREVLALMRAGAIDGLSIGFKPVKATRDRIRGLRRISQVDLWEISIVTFPMLPGARIQSIKQRPFAARRPTERELERWLTQDAGLTRSEARALLRHGLKGLPGTQDAAVAPDEASRLAQRLAGVARLLATSPLSTGNH